PRGIGLPSLPISLFSTQSDKELLSGNPPSNIATLKFGSTGFTSGKVTEKFMPVDLNIGSKPRSFGISRITLRKEYLEISSASDFFASKDIKHKPLENMRSLMINLSSIESR